MKIKREFDNKIYEIELTERELVDAYFEQQFLFDLEDVRTFFADYTDVDFMAEYGLTVEEAESRFEDVAMQLRRNMDKYDMTYEYAMSAAIAEVM